MKMTFHWRAALAVLVAAGVGGLGGCGGGGGGASGPPAVSIIGGSVLGLASTVGLQNNGTDNLSVSADGAFTFTTPAASYDVTVQNQPAGQTCTVSNGSGTTVGPIGTVVVDCVTHPVSNFAIGGTATGLSGALVLRNNAGDDLSVAGDGAFSFATPTSAYHVTLLSQAAGQLCSVSNGKGIAGATVTNVAVNCANVSGTLALHAGNLGGYGSADGTGAGAGLNGAQGVATDAAGNVYVADGGNQAIRKITPAGVVTTFAGSAGLGGAADGTGGAARFSNPRAVATDSAGNVFVADTGNHTIRRITPAGEVTTLAGSPGVSGSVDSTGVGARFNLPTGVAVDARGNVFVADSGNHSIRKVSAAGVVSTWAGSAGNPGLVNGSAAAARFNNPNGLAFDSAGNLFVGDTNNDAVRRIASDGTVSSFAGSLIRPAGLSTDGADNFYVAQVESHVISKITPAAVVTLLAGAAGLNGSADGSASTARFYRPFGVAADGAGNVYIADTGNSLIRRIDAAAAPAAVSTLAGSVAIGGSADGTGGAARFLGASGVTTDSAGFIYVADRLDHAIRKITPAGAATTFAGTRGGAVLVTSRFGR